MSWLDDTFAAVAALALVPCGQASGTNTLALTPTTTPSTPNITAYANYQAFSFIALNTSTGPVTVNVNGIGALPLFRSNGATQAGANDLVSGNLYVIIFNLALNAGGGGFALQAGGSGKLVQRLVATQAGANTLSTSGILFSAVFTVSDGINILAQSITPVNASNQLLVRATTIVTPLSSAGVGIGAIKQLITAGSAALGTSVAVVPFPTGTATITSEGTFALTNTSSLTVQSRVALVCPSTGNIAFNRNATSVFNDTLCTLIVEEWTTGV